jgi:hypothetical protein
MKLKDLMLSLGMPFCWLINCLLSRRWLSYSAYLKSKGWWRVGRFTFVKQA